MDKILYLSDDEVFMTLEGEGKNIGLPSIFLRFSMCNLSCIGWASPENPNGCDSKSSWIVKNKFTFEELFKYFEDRNFHENLKRGDILKLTGGEVFLQEKNVYEWCIQARERWQIRDLRIEFETNATLIPKCNWNIFHTSYICSPKLANNGDPENKRYKPDALEWHANNITSTFKFVICNEKDLDELFEKYINEFEIDNRRIWLMPECSSTAQFKEKAPWIAELCMKHNFNFSPRLQILIWEKCLKR
jgi:7-carboxy-7-deazaguanine synthase